MRVQAKTLALRNKFLGGSSTASGTFGAIGSVPNVCHSLCMTIVSALALFGITINILPLMFLQTYTLYFWLVALAFTVLSFYFYLKQNKQHTRDRNLLLINGGILIIALPFSQLSDYMDFFRFIGGSLVVIGLFLFFLGKRFALANWRVEETREMPVHTQATNLNSVASMPQIPSKISLPKFNLTSALFALVIGGFLINQYLMYTMNGMDNMNFLSTATNTTAVKQVSQMKLTAFDQALARERMDKNNDGICDTCGMPIQQCIDTGQIDCNMGNNPNAIGVLGTQHIHADWKIYINGKALDSAFFDPLSMNMTNSNNQKTSSFLHVDKGAPAPEKVGDVLHMHAKKVPLWLFFRSVGMSLTKDSFTAADGQVLKNENGKTLKFYLNGKKVDELADYVFQPYDKLLISYGPENDPDIQEQLNSVTNFAKNH